MLKNIPSNLSPELLKVLMEMGHGDEIIIADGNYPGASLANILIRLDGQGVSEILQSVLELLPLDNAVEKPVSLMEVSKGDDYTPVIWDEFKEILTKNSTNSINIEYLERHEFYERSKHAYAIVMSSETALYANILLKKGVVS